MENWNKSRRLDVKGWPRYRRRPGRYRPDDPMQTRRLRIKPRGVRSGGGRPEVIGQDSPT